MDAYMHDVRGKGSVPHIEYPCQWSYRIIGSDEKALRKAISECAKGTDYRVSRSKRSSSGTYVSLNLEIVIHSEEARLGIYHSLSGNPLVKIVL